MSIASLMIRAGAGTADVARRLLRPRGGRRVVVLVGKGNNGGDGLVAARDLDGDAAVVALMVVPDASLRGDPAAHLAALRGRRARIEDSAHLDDAALDGLLRDADLLIDAIFGTGFRGPAAGEPARVIEAANRSGIPILAVDVPSGIDAATGGAAAPVRARRGDGHDGPPEARADAVSGGGARGPRVRRGHRSAPRPRRRGADPRGRSRPGRG